MMLNKDGRFKFHGIVADSSQMKVVNKSTTLERVGGRVGGG